MNDPYDGSHVPPYPPAERGIEIPAGTVIRLAQLASVLSFVWLVSYAWHHARRFARGF